MKSSQVAYKPTRQIQKSNVEVGPKTEFGPSFNFSTGKLEYLPSFHFGPRYNFD